MAKIRIQKGTIPVTLRIDDTAIAATITRFTLEQAAAFRQSFQRTQQNRAELALLKRKNGEDWSIPDAEIRRRRLHDMTAEERGAHEHAAQQEEAEALAFLVQCVQDHLTIAPGQVQLVDGDTERDVLSGADFVTAFSHRQDVLMTAFATIAAQRETPAAAATETPAA